MESQHKTEYKYDVSVVVLTYNSDYNRIIKTLASIIKQKSCTFEIIISDDGSKDFFYVEIDKWFKCNSFYKYKIIRQGINKGTVKNAYRACCKAKGRYIKLLSPGDFLYDDDTLAKLNSFMSANNHKITFGRSVYYMIKDNELKIVNKMNPYDTSIYLPYNRERVLESVLLYSDYVCGAGYMVERKSFLENLEKMLDRIIYCEDMTYIYMLAHGYDIGFLDENVVWYEYGIGISTNNDLVFGEKIYKDNQTLHDMLWCEIPEHMTALVEKCVVKDPNQRYIDYVHRMYTDKVTNGYRFYKNVDTMNLIKIITMNQ